MHVLGRTSSLLPNRVHRFRPAKKKAAELQESSKNNNRVCLDLLGSVADV